MRENNKTIKIYLPSFIKCLQVLVNPNWISISRNKDRDIYPQAMGPSEERMLELRSMQKANTEATEQVGATTKSAHYMQQNLDCKM